MNAATAGPKHGAGRTTSMTATVTDSLQGLLWEDHAYTTCPPGFDPDQAKPGTLGHPATFRARCVEKAAPEGLATPCLVPTWKTRDNGGYARVRVGVRTVKAHRYSYELAEGPIPAGLQLDHLCRVRECVQPAHLEPVTHRENVIRGDNFKGDQDTFGCGHARTAANKGTRRRPGGKCRECSRRRFAANNEIRREICTRLGITTREWQALPAAERAAHRAAHRRRRLLRVVV